MSLDTDIDKVLQIKKGIHTAIKNKGVDIANDTQFADYPEKIMEIVGGEGSDLSGLVEMYNLSNIGEQTTESDVITNNLQTLNQILG